MSTCLNFRVCCSRKTNTPRAIDQTTTEPSQSAAAIRIRDNQRRSRARRKEYVENLERKVQEYERQGVDATLEMQHAARTVALENSRLRSMLAQLGAGDTDIDAFLQSCQDREAAEALSSVSMRPMHHDQSEPERQSGAKLRSSAISDNEGDLKVSRSPSSLAHIVTSMTPPSSTESEPSLKAESVNSRYELYSSYDAMTPQQDSPLDVLASATLQQGSCCEGKVRSTTSRRSSAEAPSPSTVETSTGAATPSSAYAPEPSPVASIISQDYSSPMEMSCDAAAAIIAEMQGQGDRQAAKARLGCHGRTPCFVRNTTLFQLLDG